MWIWLDEPQETWVVLCELEMEKDEGRLNCRGDTRSLNGGKREGPLGAPGGRLKQSARV